MHGKPGDHNFSNDGIDIGSNDGIVNGMVVTIDKAGRVVVPKPLRDLLHLEPGQELELEVIEGGLQLSIPAGKMHLKEGPYGLHAVADKPQPTLRANQVRDILEQIRR